MKGHNLFFDSNYKVQHKIVSAIYVDYLPGDILAYTDTEGWHNIFVKDEFHARTKSLSKVQEITKRLHALMITDFYELKSPEAQAEQREREQSLKAQYETMVIQIEDAEADLNRLKDALADLKHAHPNNKTLNPRKEN